MTGRIEWQDVRATKVNYIEGGTVIGENCVDDDCKALIMLHGEDAVVFEGTLPELHKMLSEAMEALTECMVRKPGDHWAGYSRRWEG
jgi:acyl-coenzyme A synthetase/AMP-(fatty) acid ligase